jgi:hypothetical protein
MVARKKLTQAVERALQELGRLGGQTRAKNLSAEQRRAIAKKAAEARWKGRRQQ